MNSIFIRVFILTIAPPSVFISVFLISFSNDVIIQKITTTDSVEMAVPITGNKMLKLNE